MPTKTTFAQISDCHLYADRHALHYKANVFDNLVAILIDIHHNQTIEFIVFTGDLTQDHSELSYQNFVLAVKQVKINKPIYFLAGNHDDESLLSEFLSCKAFCRNKTIELAQWDIHLIKSKSDTPAGFVDCNQLNSLLSNKDKSNKFQFIMMHHHPIDVGYFIDRHGLTNQTEFWQTLARLNNVKGIACGHVHNALTLLPEVSGYSTPVYTCPATSIQFDPISDTVKNAQKGAGYRTFTLHKNGDVEAQAYFIND